MHAKLMIFKNVAYKNIIPVQNIAISSERIGQKTNLNTKTSRQQSERNNSS